MSQPAFHPEIRELTLGYMPLLDSAALLWAGHRGHFQAAGLEVTLAREVSWASLRDRLAYGALDAALCLAPMPAAATLGADQVGVPLVTGLTLAQNSAAITFSHSMARQLGLSAGMSLADSARAVATFIQAGGSLRLAHVFQFSMHHYLLRAWLAMGGLAGDDETGEIAGIRFSVVPPAQMVRHLESGAIDGFCAGEPWNTAAMQGGLGVVIATAADIWDGGPDKVLGVTEAWARACPQTHRALIMAVLQAQRELAAGDCHDELVELLIRERVLALPPEVLLASLRGEGAGSPPRFATGLEAFPRRSQLAWCAAQMLRWRQWQGALDLSALAERVCDVSAYADAAAALGLPRPVQDGIVEGSGDVVLGGAGETVRSRFSDGSTFTIL